MSLCQQTEEKIHGSRAVGGWVGERGLEGGGGGGGEGGVMFLATKRKILIYNAVKSLKINDI